MTETTAPAVTETQPLAKLSIKETVLAQFREAETVLVAMAAKYSNVAYAVGTTAGMKEAVAARADLRDNGRLFVTKAEARIKGEVNELKRIMADETERLVAIVKPVEDAVDAQIKAEEKRKADEKEARELKEAQERAAKEKIEADRVSAHRANIDKINGYVSRAIGQPIDVIERGVAIVAAMEFGPEWEEFANEAAAGRDAAVAGLNKLISDERIRLENERLQKELADARAALAALTPTQPVAQSPSAAIPTEKASDSAEHSPSAKASAAPAAVTITPQQAWPMPVGASVTHDDVVGLMPTSVKQAMAPKPQTPPSLRIGEIANRLGFGITAAFLRTLGFEPAGKEGASVLFHESDFPAICQAVIKHVAEVAEQFHPVEA